MKTNITKFTSKSELKKDDIIQNIQTVLNDYNLAVMDQLQNGLTPKLIAIILNNSVEESIMDVFMTSNTERKDLAMISLDISHELIYNI